MPRKSRATDRQTLEVTGESDESFAHAAEVAWQHALELAKKQGKTITKAEVVKMECRPGSTLYVVVLRIPQF